MYAPAHGERLHVEVAAGDGVSLQQRLRYPPVEVPEHLVEAVDGHRVRDEGERQGVSGEVE